MSLAQAEFVDNPESRCPVVLLLDTSKSMAGTPIAELASGVATFKADVARDDLAALRVEIAVITFGGEARLAHDFATVDGFEPPLLRADGETPMGAAIELGLDLVEARKRTYNAHGIKYYRPWVFLITDGAPTDGKRWEQAAARVGAMEDARKLSFFAIGVAGANMDILGRITPPSRPPLRLQTLAFRDLFEWLSASVKRVSVGKIGAEAAIYLPAALGRAPV